MDQKKHIIKILAYESFNNPCYNEKKYIIEILNRINDIENLDYDIIVDDASNDGSTGYSN